MSIDLRAAVRPNGDPELYVDKIRMGELLKCSESPHYFINNYLYILNRGKWVNFQLYPIQDELISALLVHQKLISLKSRQVGFTTTIGGAYFLWLLLFEPNAFCLVLSKSEREAQALLTDRFRPMFDRLPSWMKPREIEADSKSEFILSNGGMLRSLPTSGGDSYTCRAVLIDEAALVYRSRTSLQQVLLNVYPTVEAGGQLILNSKADKSRPDSTFNNIWRGATGGENDFYPLFAPWTAVPTRDNAWYQRQVEFSKSIDGTMDFVDETYPDIWENALKPKEVNRRLPYKHVLDCYDPRDAIEETDAPAIDKLLIYKEPEVGRQYIVCADPAEGNPNSDDSCLDVFDWDTGEQVANLAGKIDTTQFSVYIQLVSEYYIDSPVWIERNNHGHAVIALLLAEGKVRLLRGPDSTKRAEKHGYLTSAKYKAIAYVKLADLLKDGEVTIRKKDSFDQLVSIQGDTLKAPDGQHDDHAMTFVLYAAAKEYVSLRVLIDFV